MIEIDSLTKRYGRKTVVDDLSFNCAAGEVLGFLGPNGAGKSTTMKMLTGFVSPSDGHARLCGYDVQEETLEVRRRLGYLPEGAPCYAEMTPGSFLDFVADIRGLSGSTRATRLEEVIETMHLGPVLHQSIETLSKGFKRRVGLAQAILHNPDVLILDEPTDGLDPNQKHEVRELIRSMSPDKLIVISTHILEEVEAVCSRAVIIAGGRLVFDGTPLALMARSALHNAVTISIETIDIEHARGAIAALSGVASVKILEQADSRGTLQVLAIDGAPLAAPVSALSRDHNWQVHGLSVERGRLDDVFRDITRAGGPERG